MSENYFAITQVLADFQAPGTLTLPTNTFDDLGMDSLDAIAFAYAVEEKFGLCLEEPRWNGRTKLSEAVALIDKKIAKARP